MIPGLGSMGTPQNFAKLQGISLSSSSSAPAQSQGGYGSMGGHPPSQPSYGMAAGGYRGPGSHTSGHMPRGPPQMGMQHQQHQAANPTFGRGPPPQQMPPQMGMGMPPKMPPPPFGAYGPSGGGGGAMPPPPFQKMPAPFPGSMPPGPPPHFQGRPHGQ
jgi:hypothetical protein